jgi:hypothetical protein
VVRQHLNSNAACGSHRFNSGCGVLFVAFAKILAMPNTCPSAFVSPVTSSPPAKTLGAHSIGGSRLAPVVPRILGNAGALLGIAVQSCRSRNHCWPLQVGRMGWHRRGQAAIEPCPAQVWWRPAARFSYSRAMPPRKAVQPNPSLKWSTNGVPSGLGHGCTHIFHGPGLPSRRWCST